MKRLWIVFAIIAVMLLVSALALWHLSAATNQLLSRLEELSEAIEQRDAQQTQTLASTFIREWHTSEMIMMRYLHHESLDTITCTAARLPALAKYEQYPELAAEVECVQGLIYHVYESEIPNWKNIL